MKQYEMFELTFKGEEPAGSWTQVPLSAVFTLNGKSESVKGFYAGNNTYKVRFYPRAAGKCEWTVKSDISLTGKLSGNEDCRKSDGKKHGMVKASGLCFRYEDGSRYMPFGTTVYALIHQEPALIERTMTTLKNAPFNKVRMCVFPKHYEYNSNEPLMFAFEKDENGGFDIDRPDFKFWDAFEDILRRMEEMEIQADLILFHAYDCWGFSKLSFEQCITYLDYAIRRLSAFPNTWWSLANEYELLTRFKPDWWEKFAEYIGKNDPYGHLLSNHNFLKLWNFDNPYVTHCSIQDANVIRVPDLQKKYKKPVIFDECCYEGDIPQPWGSISGFEMVNRFWTAFAMGGYCTHGETYLDDNEVLWWAKGGKLKGESPSRIAFLREIMEELPGELEYIKSDHELNIEDPEHIKESPAEISEIIGGIRDLLIEVPPARATDFFDQNRTAQGRCENDEAILLYLGRRCCKNYPLWLPENGAYNIEVIDVWEMTRTTVMESAKGNVVVPLPAKEGIAVLAKKI